MNPRHPNMVRLEVEGDVASKVSLDDNSLIPLYSFADAMRAAAMR